LHNYLAIYGGHHLWKLVEAELTMQGIFNAADIGNQIREKRLAQGMNQTVLAKKLGCSRKWVSDIEQGNETAEISRVLRALTVLGIKIFVGQSEAVESKELTPQYKEILVHREQFGGAPQVMSSMSKLGMVENPLKETLDRMSKLGMIKDPLKETLDRMSKLGMVENPLKETLDRMSKLGMVENPLKETLDRMSKLGMVENPLKETLDRMSKLGMVENPLKETLDRMSKLGMVENPLKETLDRTSKLGMIKDPLTKSLSEKTTGSKLLPALLPPEAFKDEGQPSATTTEEASATKPQLPEPGKGEDD
jgi:transcriptional regulator with XRE-family HTH domain